MRPRPRYSIGTYDWDLHAYTPQRGAGRSINVSKAQLRRVLKRLRELGYTAHRTRGEDGEYWDNDTSTLVERTDGMTKAEILEGWKR